MRDENRDIESLLLCSGKAKRRYLSLMFGGNDQAKRGSCLLELKEKKRRREKEKNGNVNL